MFAPIFPQLLLCELQARRAFFSFWQSHDQSHRNITVPQNSKGKLMISKKSKYFIDNSNKLNYHIIIFDISNKRRRVTEKVPDATYIRRGKIRLPTQEKA
jgi:hypothetical protein